MARRHGTQRFVRPAPRTKIWIGSGIGEVTIVANADAVIATLSAGALLLRPFTILRTRLLISFSSDQILATERPQGSYGEIVVTATAAALGTTVVPDPSSTDGDPDADWYVHQECIDRFVFQAAGGAREVQQVQYVVDSKAMRKVGPNDDVAVVFSETAGFGAVLTMRGRQLIQLH